MSKDIIGPKIKEFRKKRKLTQDDLASSLGYSGKSVISHIEKGDADMTYEKILLLLRTYMADANELFDLESADRQIEEWKLQQRKSRSVLVYIHSVNDFSKAKEEFCYLAKYYDLLDLVFEDIKPWETKDYIRDNFSKLTASYKEVVVVANSIGAFFVYEYLADSNIKQAFFVSPIVSMFQLILGIKMSTDSYLESLKEEKILYIDNKNEIPDDFYKSLDHEGNKWKVPTEILYGEKDKIVYIENIAEFLANHPNSKLTIKKETGHNFITKEDKDFIKKWILKSLR